MYGDEVTPVAMLCDVMRGIFVPPPTTDLPYQKPFSRPFACIYPLLSTSELYPSRVSFALLIVDGRLDCLLEPDVNDFVPEHCDRTPSIWIKLRDSS